MDKVTGQCPQTTAFLKRKESRSGIEPRSFRLPAYRLTDRPNRLSIYVGPWVGYIYSGTVPVPPPTQQTVFPFCTVSLRQPSRLTGGQSKLSQMTCFSEDMKCWGAWLRHYLRAQSQGCHTIDRVEEREAWQRSEAATETIFLERTREGHPSVRPEH